MNDLQLTVPATYQPLTIATGIRCSARRTPDKPMFIEGEKRRTFAQFCERIDRLQAHALGELGLAFGQHAAVVGPNCIEFLEVVVGLSEVGIASATLRHIGQQPPACDGLGRIDHRTDSMASHAY